ncbi:MAG: hypothetical protein ACYDEF_04330 [Methanosarcina sp.]
MEYSILYGFFGGNFVELYLLRRVARAEGDFAVVPEHAVSSMEGL